MLIFDFFGMKVGVSEINDHKYLDVSVKDYTSNTKSNSICRKADIIHFLLTIKLALRKPS